MDQTDIQTDSQTDSQTDTRRIERDLADVLQQVEAVLDKQGKGFAGIDQEVSRAVCSLVDARNLLAKSERLGKPTRPSAQLDHINGLLSVLASVEYPLAGIHWPRIKQVRDDLRKLVGAGASA